MSCKAWKLMSWLFLGIVAVQALYCGVKMGHWMGLIAIGVVLTCGLIYGKFRKSNSCD